MEKVVKNSSGLKEKKSHARQLRQLNRKLFQNSVRSTTQRSTLDSTVDSNLNFVIQEESAFHTDPFLS